MAARPCARDALPTSHVFITVARGRSARTFVTRSGLAFAVLAAVPVLGLWLLASTLYLVFHDDLVASLMLRQRDMQYAYEDKIAALRTQINHDASRQLLSQRAVEAKLDELSSRESELQRRSGIVARLEDQAGHLAASADVSVAGRTLPRTTAMALQPPDNPGTPVVAAEPHDRAGTAKPRPEAATSISVDPVPGKHADDAETGPAPERLSDLSTRMDSISANQETRIAALDAQARKAVLRYRDALSDAGLSESRFAASGAGGSGGPFVPLAPDDASPFARAAVGVQLTLSQAEHLASSIARVPFGRPLQGDPEVTSPFGARVDPFLGRPAMHTGIDLAEDNGTDVRATAPGRVTVAGPVGGYGTMVEIDHGAGLTTRYAHLSEADVTMDQFVVTGAVIGHVGATGRATGPHLHYETRIDGEAVDPLRFLAAGQRLLFSRLPL